MESEQPIEKLLIEAGYASEFYFNINTSLHVPYDTEYTDPWNLPSRLFRFPVSVDDGRIGLNHPLLAEHPFVRELEANLDITFDPEDDFAEATFGGGASGQWHHAVDLMTKKHWRDLLRTRQFTNDDYIAAAVELALSRADFTLRDARAVMETLAKPEPSDPQRLLPLAMAPAPLSVDNSKDQKKTGVYYPINIFSRRDDDGADRAWLRIIGIERKWFAYARNGHLGWTDLGRDRYAATTADPETAAAAQAITRAYVKPIQLDLF